MFKNYFKVAVRNLIRHKIYSLINILGLGIGMTAFILIALLLQHEYSWDKFNKNYERIYRVQQEVFYDDYRVEWTQTPYTVSEKLKMNFPEFEKITVVKETWGEYLTTSEDKLLKDDDGYFADESVFDVFTFFFIEGSPENSLSTPGQTILTKTLAEKLFPNENAMGKVIKASQCKSLIVTGIIEDLPVNSSLRVSYLVSLSTLDRVWDWDYKERNDVNNFRTYVLLAKNADPLQASEKIHNLFEDLVENNNKYPYLKALEDIHLKATDENTENSPYPYYAAVAIFIMILAGINFINLTTARAGLREKEIGIRKVVGGKRSTLIVQFLSESVLICLLAMIASFIFVELSLSTFNSFMETNLALHYFQNYGFTFFIIGVFFIVGIFSGLYPAIYLSSFKPVLVIKGNTRMTKSGKMSRGVLRKFLVTFQFVISTLLILSTLFIFKHVNFMKNKDLGYSKTNLLRCYIDANESASDFSSLRNRLLSDPSIVDVSMAANLPFYGNWGREVNWEGSAPDEKLNVRYNITGYDYIKTMEMKMVKGRFFEKEFSTDESACVINETFASKIGWDDPIGKGIDSNKYRVIGVVKDFHPYSVHNEIPPFMMVLSKEKLSDGGNFVIKIKPGESTHARQYAASVFGSFFPENIFEVQLYDSDLDRETMAIWEGVKNTFGFFSFLTVGIALVGLLGLVSFTTQRKTKEIGIRKVLGAKVSGLYFLISKEFLFLLAIGITFGAPGAYIFIKTAPGAYKCSYDIFDYLIPITIIFIVTIITTLQQVLAVTRANPVKALKDE